MSVPFHSMACVESIIPTLRQHSVLAYHYHMLYMYMPLYMYIVHVHVNVTVCMCDGACTTCTCKCCVSVYVQRKNPNWKPNEDGALFMSQLKESGTHTHTCTHIHTHTHTHTEPISLPLQWKRCREATLVLLETLWLTVPFVTALKYTFRYVHETPLRQTLLGPKPLSIIARCP